MDESGSRLNFRSRLRHTDDVTVDLIEEFTEWLDEHGVPDADVLADHAERFVVWRGSAPLTTLNDDDVREFLLEWCPRQLTLPADRAGEMCEAVGEFVFFLGHTGRLRCGVDQARRMTRAAIGLTDTMTARMADPANFGMAKSLFAGIEGAESMTRDEFEAALQQRVDEHNALPLEARRAATDRFFQPAPIELPFRYVPPPQADVDAAVARAALPAKVRALRDYLGEDGKALTTTGNLKLADGRALVDLLDTGDELDPKVGDRTFTTRSTARLPRLMYLVELAIAIGAVRRHNKRLIPVKAWTKKTPLQHATTLFETVVDAGVLSATSAGWSPYADMDAVLDAGVVHWLAPLLAPDARADVDHIVALSKTVITHHLSGPPVEHYVNGDPLAHDVSQILEMLAMTGAVEWTEYRDAVTSWGSSYRVGGTIALTAFGRHALPELLPDAGLSLRTAVDLASASLDELLTELSHTEPEQYSAVLDSWQPSQPAPERAGAIAAMITDAPDARTRLFGLHLLKMFDAEVAEPFMRQLLDTAAAGHSAIWLLDHGLADGDTVGRFITPAIMVDILSELVDHPEALCEQFLVAHHPEAMLESFWRHRAPETAVVLDALGRHLPDRALAKQARRAALRHRSWMANGPKDA